MSVLRALLFGNLFMRFWIVPGVVKYLVWKLDFLTIWTRSPPSGFGESGFRKYCFWNAAGVAGGNVIRLRVLVLHCARTVRGVPSASARIAFCGWCLATTVRGGGWLWPWLEWLFCCQSPRYFTALVRLGCLLSSSIYLLVSAFLMRWSLKELMEDWRKKVMFSVFPAGIRMCVTYLLVNTSTPARPVLSFIGPLFSPFCFLPFFVSTMVSTDRSEYPRSVDVTYVKMVLRQ